MTVRIDNPDAISLSKFENMHGEWAKRWGQVIRVRVEFSDGREPVLLTPTEYKALPAEIQYAITRAPSSGPPLVEEP
jgi:hypothetical protein